MTTQSEYEPTSNYTIQNIEGWTVYVNNRLLNENKSTGDEVLSLLKGELYDINRTVPKLALEKLHEVPIWLEAESEQVECACYHPSKKWMSENGFNPDKAKSVEIGNSANFLNDPQMYETLKNLWVQTEW